MNTDAARDKMTGKKHITPPLDSSILKTLRAGDEVLLSGTIYTARDAAHKRLVEELRRFKKMPVDLRGQILYYTGPAPEKPGSVIGPAGPTTSMRMDAYTPVLLEKTGLKGMIGKGGRGKQVIDALKKNKAVYFVAVGGAAALLSKCIKKSEVILYHDLGTEAIRRLEVQEFPVIVMNDIYGGDLGALGIQRYKKHTARQT